MTDILEEILAFTEGYKRGDVVDDDDGLRCDPNPSALSVPQAMVGATLPAHQYFPPQFAPSPRGVQDDLSAFHLIHRNSPHAYAKNPLVVAYNGDQSDQAQPDHSNPHQDSATAAAVQAAISTCVSRPSRPSPDAVYNTRRPAVTTCTQTGDGSDATATLSSTPLDTTGHRPNLGNTSSAELTYMSQGPDADDNTMHNGHMSTMQQAGWSSNKRSYATAMDTESGMSRVHCEEDGSVCEEEETEEGVPKKMRTGVSVVMPPSAKSILERRERAIREGRRKDAKLTESERRILRRLRNRESAERCRLRRVQQAVQLEQKIASMQVENKRLVAMVDKYEKTIKRLERVIGDFSAQQQRQQRQTGAAGL